MARTHAVARPAREDRHRLPVSAASGRMPSWSAQPRQSAEGREGFIEMRQGNQELRSSEGVVRPGFGAG